MRIYVSSTFEDLAEHRDAATRALRQLGHDVVAMEDYSAASAPPLTRVLEDVASCDAYVGIFGWHYGHRPRKIGSGPNLPGTTFGTTSITEYEYRQANNMDLEILVFLADESAPWPVNLIDGVVNPRDAKAVANLRAELQERRLLAYFTTPDSLAARVSAAVSALGVRVEVERRLIRPIQLQSELPNLGSQPIYDSHVTSLQKFFADASTAASTVVDLDQTWWSSRLYLLGALGETLGELKRIVFLSDGRYLGVASSGTVRRQMLYVHDDICRGAGVPNPLRDFDEGVPHRHSVTNLSQTLDGLINQWNVIAGPDDNLTYKSEVSSADLHRWLGESLFTEPVRVDDSAALTIVDLLRILDYPNNYVPVVGAITKTAKKAKKDAIDERSQIHLVDKIALTDRLARNSVTETLDRLGI